MYQCRNNTHPGFTLIELMIAVAFVGGLLVTITLVIMQIMSLYNKGLTLKEVDGVTRVVTRDMQQGIAASNQFKLQYEGTADSTGHKPLITAKTLVEAATNNVDYYNNDAGGRLCTGNYSYIWNTGQAIRNAVRPLTGTIDPTVRYHDPSDTTSSTSYPLQTLVQDGSTVPVVVHFMKVRDTAKALCQIPSGDNPTAPLFATKAGNIKDFENMFGSGDNNLMLYKFAITTPDFTRYGDTLATLGSRVTVVATFYSIQMVIGTQMGDEADEGLVSTNNASCEAPKDAQMNDSEYCAVNHIEFVARTGSISQ